MLGHLTGHNESMELEITNSAKPNPTQLEAWQQLFDSTPSARFYHHPHWISCIGEHLSKAELRIAFVSISGQLKMVVPLCDSKGSLRRAHPAHDHLSLNDILFDAQLLDKPDELFDCLNAALCEMGTSWLDWQISNIPHFSPLITALLTNTPESVAPDTAAASLNVDRQDNTDEWMLRQTRQTASFDCTSDQCPPHGKLRRNLRRLRKQMQEGNEVRVERVRQATELDAAFSQFLNIEASGWKGQGEEATAISANDDLTAFYSALLKPDVPGIQPEINLLWCAEHCVAAQFGLRTGKYLSLLKIGYNEDFARFSPGYLLLESVLAEATEQGVETVSLVTSPPWANRWHPDTSPVWHINRYNNTSLGTAKHQIDKLKQVVKSRLKKAA